MSLQVCVAVRTAKGSTGVASITPASDGLIADLVQLTWPKLSTLLPSLTSFDSKDWTIRYISLGRLVTDDGSGRLSDLSASAHKRVLLVTPSEEVQPPSKKLPDITEGLEMTRNISDTLTNAFISGPKQTEAGSPPPQHSPCPPCPRSPSNTENIRRATSDVRSRLTLKLSKDCFYDNKE